MNSKTQTQTQTEADTTKMFAAATDAEGIAVELLRDSPLFCVGEGHTVELVYDSVHSDNPVSVTGEVADVRAIDRDGFMCADLRTYVLLLEDGKERSVDYDGAITTETGRTVGQLVELRAHRPQSVTDSLEAAVERQAEDSDDDEDDDSDDDSGAVEALEALEEGDSVRVTWENRLSGAEVTHDAAVHTVEQSKFRDAPAHVHLIVDGWDDVDADGNPKTLRVYLPTACAKFGVLGGIGHHGNSPFLVTNVDALEAEDSDEDGDGGELVTDGGEDDGVITFNHYHAYLEAYRNGVRLEEGMAVVLRYNSVHSPDEQVVLGNVTHVSGFHTGAFLVESASDDRVRWVNGWTVYTDNRNGRRIGEVKSVRFAPDADADEDEAELVTDGGEEVREGDSVEVAFENYPGETPKEVLSGTVTRVSSLGFDFVPEGGSSKYWDAYCTNDTDRVRVYNNSQLAYVFHPDRGTEDRAKLGGRVEVSVSATDEDEAELVTGGGDDEERTFELTYGDSLYAVTHDCVCVEMFTDFDSADGFVNAHRIGEDTWRIDELRVVPQGGSWGAARMTAGESWEFGPDRDGELVTDGGEDVDAPVYARAEEGDTLDAGTAAGECTVIDVQEYAVTAESEDGTDWFAVYRHDTASYRVRGETRHGVTFDRLVPKDRVTLTPSEDELVTDGGWDEDDAPSIEVCHLGDTYTMTFGYSSDGSPTIHGHMSVNGERVGKFTINRLANLISQTKTEIEFENAVDLVRSAREFGEYDNVQAQRHDNAERYTPENVRAMHEDEAEADHVPYHMGGEDGELWDVAEVGDMLDAETSAGECVVVNVQGETVKAKNDSEGGRGWFVIGPRDADTYHVVGTTRNGVDFATTRKKDHVTLTPSEDEGELVTDGGEDVDPVWEILTEAENSPEVKDAHDRTSRIYDGIRGLDGGVRKVEVEYEAEEDAERAFKANADRDDRDVFYVPDGRYVGGKSPTRLLIVPLNDEDEGELVTDGGEDYDATAVVKAVRLPVGSGEPGFTIGRADGETGDGTMTGSVGAAVEISSYVDPIIDALEALGVDPEQYDELPETPRRAADRDEDTTYNIEVATVAVNTDADPEDADAIRVELTPEAKSRIPNDDPVTDGGIDTATFDQWGEVLEAAEDGDISLGARVRVTYQAMCTGSMKSVEGDLTTTETPTFSGKTVDGFWVFGQSNQRIGRICGIEITPPTPQLPVDTRSAR